MIANISFESLGTDGDGIAPCGHTVHVATSADFTVNVSARVRLTADAGFSAIKPIVEQAIREYIDDVGFNDGIGYHAKLIAAILGCSDKILDTDEVKMNGQAKNIVLTKQFSNYQVPCGDSPLCLLQMAEPSGK